MQLVTAAERRSPYAAIIIPARFTDSDPTPLSPLPPDLGRTYARTELCRDCSQVPAFRSLYPLEFRHNLISCLLTCWACGYNFFKPKSALGLACSVASSLRSNAADAIRHHERQLIKAEGMTNP